ncbi:MAG: flagellar motor switch protein FliN [Myxococcota bacterium]|jgi:flagellar motor switch protein FliN/FliY|nr:flagellar motor switch protein FliN [Myxococcota bacterium]
MSAGEQTDELPDVNEAVGQVTEGDAGAGLDVVMDVPLRLSVEIGSTQLLVREILQLAKGSVVELDRMNGEPADVFVNERLVARGEVTVVDEKLAVKILEVVAGDVAGARTR